MNLPITLEQPGGPTPVPTEAWQVMETCEVGWGQQIKRESVPHPKEDVCTQLPLAAGLWDCRPSAAKRFASPRGAGESGSTKAPNFLAIGS